MVTTRLVLSLFAIAMLTAGAVAVYRDREVAGAWLFAVGFAMASLWGAMSLLLSMRGQANVGYDVTAMLTSMALVFTIFYLQRAINREEIF